MNKALATDIKDFFDANIEKLSLPRKQQYASRMYRLTGQRKYRTIVFANAGLNLKSLAEIRESISNLGKARMNGRKILDHWRENDWYRKMRRLSLYSSMPEYLTYRKAVFHLLKIKNYKMKNLLREPIYKESINILRTIDFKRYILKDNVIRRDPSQNINMVYWLCELGIMDIKEDFKKILFKVFPLSGPSKNDLEFQNHIYAYTHIIIAESRFYQIFPKKGTELSKIVNFLSSNLDLILTRGSTDMVAEVGVALRLMQDNDRESQIESFLVSRYNGKYIKMGNYRNLNKLQHTNMLAIMYLMNFRKLHEGPYVSR